MDKELQLLLPMLNGLAEIDGGRYYTGTMAGHDIIATKVGIGKVNAALGADTIIREYAPDMVINTGVAGGTGATADPARVLDVVLATEGAYHLSLIHI